MFNQLFAIIIVAARRSRNQNVEVADGLTPAAKRTGRNCFLNPRIILQMFSNLFRLHLSNIQQKAPSNSPIIFNRLQQFLLVLLSHARQFAYFSLPRKFLHSLQIANLVRTPNQRHGLRPEPLHLEKFQHRRPIFLQHLGMQRQLSLMQHFIQVGEHALADAGNCQHLLGIFDQIGNLLWERLNSLGRIAIRPDTKRVLPINL